MQPVQPNTSLPGLSQSEVVSLSERLYHLGNEGFLFCTPRCITHFAEDSIPYHPGEKACLDRCLSKIRDGLRMSVEAKKDFEQKLKAGDMPYQWMKDAAAGKLN